MYVLWSSACVITLLQICTRIPPLAYISCFWYLERIGEKEKNVWHWLFHHRLYCHQLVFCCLPARILQFWVQLQWLHSWWNGKRKTIMAANFVDDIQVSAKCTLPTMEKENIINQILRKDEWVQAKKKETTFTLYKLII